MKKTSYEYTDDIGGNGCLFIKFSGKNSSGARVAEFLCQCGNKFITRPDKVKSNHTRSCGCHQKEMTSKANKKHGYSRRGAAHELYGRWKNIKARCYWDKHSHYHRYGGRGIKVCDEWLNSPDLFIEWSLSNGFRTDLTIDRIDNNGDYTPENCRFVTHKENCRNRPQYGGYKK